jgi:DnaD/phage-associated family protein
MNMKAKATVYEIKGEERVVPALGGKNLLREASGDDLRVLLVLLEKGGQVSDEELSDLVGCSVGRVRASIDYWIDGGILAVSEKAKPKAAPLRSASELSSTSGAEVAEIISRRDLSSLIDEAQAIYGKTFNTSEIAVIAGLSEQLELEDGYILLLLSYCIRRGKRSLRYAEKTAFALFEEGVDSLERLEEHIRRRELAASGIGALRRMFGIGERALTKREEDAFTRWLAEYGYSPDMIGIAYDITVNTTAKASVSYADKILAKWYVAGCRTEEQIEELIAREKQGFATKTPVKKAEKPKPDGIGSFDTDEFFQRALERSYGPKGEK